MGPIKSPLLCKGGLVSPVTKAEQESRAGTGYMMALYSSLFCPVPQLLPRCIAKRYRVRWPGTLSALP
jgi:hypothetical protein